MKKVLFVLIGVILVAVIVACSDQDTGPAGIETGVADANESSIRTGINRTMSADKAGAPTVGSLHNELVAEVLANKASISTFSDFEVEVTSAVNTTFSKYGYPSITLSQVQDYICELDSFSISTFDYFDHKERDYEDGLDQIESAGKLTSLEADWALGLHQDVLDAGNYPAALNAIITYGIANGLPSSSSALGQGFSIYISSLEFWNAEKGWWDWYKRATVGWTDFAAGIIGSVSQPAGFWEDTGRPAVIGFLASVFMDEFFDGMFDN